MVLLLVINCGVDAGSPATSVTSESKKINTNANKLQSYPTTSGQHPKCLFTHGLSQCVCSGPSAVDSQRSVREHVQAMSKINKEKGSISKSRFVRFHRQSTNRETYISD